MIRDRLLEAVGIQTEPEHVEKASRREVLKRNAWMMGSTVVSFGIVFGILLIIDLFVAGFPPTGVGGIALAVLAICQALLLDIVWVFPWGFERWDLVAPWPYRDESAIEGDQP